VCVCVCVSTVCGLGLVLLAVLLGAPLVSLLQVGLLVLQQGVCLVRRKRVGNTHLRLSGESACAHVCACVRACVRAYAPMHSLVPSVSCPSEGNLLARSYLFFFCLSLSLLLHVRLSADLLSICVCVCAVRVCFLGGGGGFYTYSNNRWQAAIWWVGKRVVKRFDSLTLRGVVQRVCTRARALSLSERVWVVVSVCLSVSTPWFVFCLCTLRIFLP